MLRLSTACVVLLAPVGIVRAQCGNVTGEFAIPSSLPGGNALQLFDDGTGTALYLGGDFQDFGPASVDGLGRWDGTTFVPVGGGVAGAVNALAAYDDGNGPALYAAGNFTNAGGTPANFVARWNGQSWSALGTGLNGIGRSLSVWDDGTGPKLYVGGSFNSAGGQPAPYFARWNGTTWSSVGSTLFNGEVYDVQPWDDGSGPALYICGSFTIAGGVQARSVARFNGTSYSALTNENFDGSVYDLLVHDDGTGPALYAGGNFATIGNFFRGRIARWRAGAWSGLGAGVSLSSGIGTCTVNNLTAWDDGTGTKLYIGGRFDSVSGASSKGVARWTSAGWQTLSSGVDREVEDLQPFDDGGGVGLYATGFIESAGGLSAVGTVRWRGGAWSGIGEGAGLNNHVERLAVHDDGTGPAVYAGGVFTGGAALVGANLIAKWNGSAWSTLGPGLSSAPNAMLSFDDGTGTQLYVGGAFQSTNGVNARCVARWNGTQWSGIGIFNRSGDSVRDLAVFDPDASGPLATRLIAGGNFFLSGSGMRGIAQWQNGVWSPLGQGISGGVDAMCVGDIGSGPSLFVTGGFDVAGVVPAANIARWNGTHWSSLGQGLSRDADALVLHDDGSGLALYAAGQFDFAGGIPVQNIARWNGSSWSAVGSGLPDRVTSLTSVDAGGGRSLYAGGTFLRSQGAPSDRIARWDGTTWRPVGTGADNAVNDIVAYTVPGEPRPSLILGGNFLNVSGSNAARMARLPLCPFDSYCSAKLNSLGCRPAISASGEASASSASGFVVSAVNVLNQRSGLLVYGTSGRASIPLNGGTLCIAGPRFRSPVLNSGGNATGNDCSGIFSIDVNAFASGALGGSPVAGLSTPGTRVQCQFWGRDPGFAPPDNVSFSDALEFTVAP